jgi:hypothetical protein
MYLPTGHKNSIYRKSMDYKHELERNKGRNIGTHLTERKAKKWTPWWQTFDGWDILAIDIQANHK